MSNQFPNQINQRGVPQPYQQGGYQGFVGNGSHHIQPGGTFHNPQPPQGVSYWQQQQPMQSQPQFLVQAVPGFLPQQQFHPVFPPLAHHMSHNIFARNLPRAVVNPQDPNSGGQFVQMPLIQPVQRQQPQAENQPKKILTLAHPESKQEVNFVDGDKTETPKVVTEPVVQPSQAQINFKDRVAQTLVDECLQPKEHTFEADQTEKEEANQKKIDTVKEFQAGVSQAARLKQIESSANIVDASVQKIRQQDSEDACVLAAHNLFLGGFYDVLISSSFCALCVQGFKDKEQVSLLDSLELKKIKETIDDMKTVNRSKMSLKNYSREFLRLIRVSVSRISQENLDSSLPMNPSHKPRENTPQNFGRLQQPVVAGAFQTNIRRQPYGGCQDRSSEKGFSSSNSARKAPISRRASLDRSQMAPPLSDKLKEVPVQRSATAWKPKRELKLDPEEAKYLKTKLEIRGLLNKVTPTNYEDLKSEFCDFRVHDDMKMLAEVIDLIFDKAVEEPRFCPMYAELCKDQVISERALSSEQSDLFRKGILQKCQHNFNSNDSEEELKELENKLLSESIEQAAKDLLEAEISLFKSKSKRRAKGIMTLIAELYRHSMLQDAVINWCIVHLLQLHNSLKEEEYIEYAVYFLETVGPIYDIHRNAYLERRKAYEKKKMGRWTTKKEDPSTRNWRKTKEEEDKEKEEENKAKEEELAMAEPREQTDVENVFLHLRQSCSSFSKRTEILILNLLDSRQNNWMQQLEKQGIKTIEEVRLEAEQEQQEKTKLRQEFNQKQKYGTYTGSRQQSRSSVPIFVGRNSGNTVRSQGQDSCDELRNQKLSKAAQSSQNAGREAPRQESDLRKAVESGQKLGRKSNFQPQLPKKL